jgi:hypothetical protein
LIPTPTYGEVGNQWWYYTHAFLSLQWSSQQEELTLEDLSAVIQTCLAEVLADVMFPSMAQEMKTAVSVGNVGRLLLIASAGDDGDDLDDDKIELSWDDFTLVLSFSSLPPLPSLPFTLSPFP